MPFSPNLSTVEYAWFENGRGDEVDLSSIYDVRDDIQFRQGTDGRFMPPVAHQLDETPGQDGAWYRGTRAGLPAIGMPLLLCAPNVAQLRDRHRVLAQGVNPKLGPGRLYMQTSDGIYRSIPAIYESGFERDPASDGSQYEQLVALNFRGLEPYWSDVVPVEQTYAKEAQGGTFFPAPAFRVGPSSVFRSWTEINEGDVEVWPVWAVTGGGHDLVIANETTGRQITLNYVIPENSTVVIDTLLKTVTGPGGVDLFPTLGGDMWPLTSLDNVLRVQLRDADDSAQVRLSYTPMFLGV